VIDLIRYPGRAIVAALAANDLATARQLAAKQNALVDLILAAKFGCN